MASVRVDEIGSLRAQGGSGFSPKLGLLDFRCRHVLRANQDATDPEPAFVEDRAFDDPLRLHPDLEGLRARRSFALPLEVPEGEWLARLVACVPDADA